MKPAGAPILRRRRARGIIAGMERSPRQVMETYLLDVVAGGRLDLIGELAREDMIDEANRAFGGPPGRAGLVAHVKGFRRNIGDLRLTVERIVADERAAMAWWAFSGTHVGPWLGRAPDGREISGTVFSLFDLIDGRIACYRLWLCAMFDEPVIFDSARALATEQEKTRCSSP